MYKFIKGGETLGFSERVRWIKKNEYGIYVQTEEESAEGVAFGGVAYNIPDGSFNELDTVTVKEVNGGEVILAVETLRSEVDFLNLLTGVDSIEDEEEGVSDDNE